MKKLWEIFWKIWAKLCSWLTAIGVFWGHYWIVISGSFLLLLSVMLRWLNFPLGRDLPAVKVPLLGSPGLISHLSLFSYGVLALGLLAVGLLFLRFSALPLALVSSLLLSLCVALPCMVAFERPEVLHRMAYEIEDISQIRKFTVKFLPQNTGAEEDVPFHLIVHTTWDRFVAATSFLGLGWYGGFYASLLLGCYAVPRLPYSRGKGWLMIVSLPVALLLLLSVRPLLGQRYLDRARVAQAMGSTEEAIADYRHAMRWDGWLRRDSSVYGLIGDLQRQAAVADDSPERHIYRGLQFTKTEEYDRAIVEFDKAAEAGGDIGLTARHESGRLRLFYGIAFLHGGAPGAAVTQWQQSLAENPNQLQAFVYLARGNYELSHYQEALQSLAIVLKAAGDTSVLANANSLSGDCYVQLGRDQEARNFYAQSLKLDNYINHWAAAGMVGP